MKEKSIKNLTIYGWKNVLIGAYGSVNNSSMTNNGTLMKCNPK